MNFIIKNPWRSGNIQKNVLLKKYQSVEYLRMILNMIWIFQEDLEKIKKAIHITYYVYKDFFGEEWKELMNESLKNVDFFKEKFIEDYKDDPLSKLDKEKLKEMVYPLNNILHT